MEIACFTLKVFLIYFSINFIFCKKSNQKNKNTVKELHDALPDITEIGKSIDNNGIKSDLWLVGTYIAAHKYFGADFRYLTGNVGPSDQVFYKKFPSPTLRDLHPMVSKACESSAMECVREILHKAKVSGSLQHLMKSQEELPTFAPFKNNYEEFKYRQTAMYYLCWHTQLEDNFLEFNEGEQSCLSYLNAVDEIPEKKRLRFVKNREHAIQDIRDADFKRDKFTCAHLWFCPDPCYGRKDGGNFIKRDFKVKGNPCLYLRNSECSWKKGANYNFFDLIRNKINITCDCETDRKGFEWNSRFGLCVDSDECFDSTANCPDNRICKNTVGAYMCTCQKGYDVNPKTNDCERMLTLHQSATMLKYKKYQGEIKQERDGDFLSEVMDFVGLSSGNCIKASSTVIFTLLLLTNAFCV